MAAFGLFASLTELYQKSSPASGDFWFSVVVGLHGVDCQLASDTLKHSTYVILLKADVRPRKRKGNENAS